MFFKKSFHKNFADFTEKHLCWRLKEIPSDTGVFVSNLQNFKEHLFWGTTKIEENDKYSKQTVFAKIAVLEKLKKNFQIFCSGLTCHKNIYLSPNFKNPNLIKRTMYKGFAQYLLLDLNKFFLYLLICGS